MSDEPHRAAFLTLLDSIAQTVHDGRVPEGAARPYVLPYISVSTPEESSLEGLSDTKLVQAVVHCVGDNAAAAALVASAVDTAVLNQRPAVSGRSCGLIRQDSALPPRRDESTGTLVMDVIAEYSFWSWPG